MTTNFHPSKFLLFASLITIGAVSSLKTNAAESHKHGTDILHVDLRTSVTNDTTASSANGQVRLKFHQQGHSTVQSLDLNVSSLDKATSYVLLASTVTNSELKPVALIETDAEGVARVRYTSVVTGNGKAHKPGRGKIQLPTELDPLAFARQIVVADTVLTQAVVTANLNLPTHLNYLVKRDISTDTVPAILRLQANNRRGQFRLNASNLAVSTEYKLLLNGGTSNGGSEEVVSTDARGKLTIRSTIENPLDALGLEDVELRDASENIVLKVSLP